MAGWLGSGGCSREAGGGALARRREEHDGSAEEAEVETEAADPLLRRLFINSAPLVTECSATRAYSRIRSSSTLICDKKGTV